ncbi:hypothetical protein E8E12_001797 [Didymella heteroderae]|uniref:Uncharacterized protein n=1 Tax=Didymella heteroderae TaxID=1769908 RepID=A0A9P5BWP0_9PLEO|nr:hypothetical protein E8E12_001797 [Didymella heteroderae]
MRRAEAPYEAASPHSREHQLQYPAITAVQQHHASKGQTSNFSEYFDDALNSTEYLHPLQQFLGSNVGTYDAQANSSNQYDVSSAVIDAQRNTPQAQQSPPKHSEGFRRGVVKYDEYPGLIGASHKASNTAQYPSGATALPNNIHRRSYSATSQGSTLTPMPHRSLATAESTEARSTLYSPYRGLFADSDAARAHRHLSTRFGRQPYILPEDDDTIELVERDRRVNVGRIYDAMICGERAQDNRGSIAMKRWVTGAHYKSDLVEAFAHKVFDCLLSQVKEGFRGWHHNDYVDDDRKGEKDDREADCAHRLEYIIDALEREKTVCEDVVNSASQIRMFVNAPIAYAQRKVQNRQGNSKRGRAKDTSDSNVRPTQRRRTGGRQMTRSTVTPDRPVSRDVTPHFQTPAPTGLPYYSTGLSQQFQSSLTPGHLAPQPPLQRSVISMPQVSANYRQATATAPPIMARPCMPPATTSTVAMSPPMVPASRPYNAHTMILPPAQMLGAQISPLPSMPSQTCTSHSSPPSLEDVEYPNPASSPEDWPTYNTVDTLDTSVCTPVDPSLLTKDLFFAQEACSSGPCPVQTTDGKNDHNQQQRTTHVSLADIESTSEAVDAHHDDPVHRFVSDWNSIPCVQEFFFDGTATEAVNQY